MARGRNAGFRKLATQHPSLRWVQFVDGDCEVDPTWVAKGLALLQEREDVVAVCGFRRERFPEASVYNRLINLEWQGPVGEISACGGDAIYRAAVFANAGGFNEAMIAGEEPELCVRLRRDGGRIWRIDARMTLHDAAIDRFSQWWKRLARGGHAYAEGFALHGGPPFFHNRKALRSCLILGLSLPTVSAGSAILALAFPITLPWCVAIVSVTTLAFLKAGWGAYQARRALGNLFGDSCLYAAFCLLGKVPEAQGALQFFVNKILGRRSALIEYKTTTDA
jgi:cellulose synthase/poly-beta-1,6-N-acetylglucosamine synthase-like glycosyltransferase